MDTILQNWLLIVLAVAGVLLVLAFFIVYFIRSFTLSRNLKQFTINLEPLRNQGADPRKIEPSNQQLHHLWRQYCETLHEEKTIDENGLEVTRGRRATLPASAVFYGSSVIDGPLGVEFFKHLPGLLTGLGLSALLAVSFRGFGMQAAAAAWTPKS